ncbi:MAG: hypothetical protein F6K19_15870 [Cyanothece sp. SIO1E1]|nr:hypothetical protein [Cyanothece sp. SIO1E1]
MAEQQNMVAQFHERTDSEWEIVKEFYPFKEKGNTICIIMDGTFWILPTGCQCLT